MFSYIKTNSIAYYLLEVDTSDTNKPLSTKVILASKVEKLESFIENVENKLLRGSLSWPKDYLDNIIGSDNHFGVSHQKSNKNGSLTEEDIVNWSARFYYKVVDFQTGLKGLIYN